MKPGKFRDEALKEKEYSAAALTSMEVKSKPRPGICHGLGTKATWSSVS